MLRADAMPVITLSFIFSAKMIRMTRTAVFETINEMALLKGASRRRMGLGHALPSALGPVANAMALSPRHFAGSVIKVETFLTYTGLAPQMVDAVSTGELPSMRSWAMIFCVRCRRLITIADVTAILSNRSLRR